MSLHSVIICHLIQYAVHTFGKEVYGLDWRTFSLSRCSCRRGILVSSNGQPAVTNVAVVQKERKTVENGHAYGANIMSSFSCNWSPLFTFCQCPLFLFFLFSITCIIIIIMLIFCQCQPTVISIDSSLPCEGLSLAGGQPLLPAALLT